MDLVALESRLDKQELINCFEVAKQIHSNFIGVRIKVPGCSKEEVIINPQCNFDIKQKYYTKHYTDDLVGQHCPDIQITGIAYGDDYTMIEQHLLYYK